MRPGRRYSKVDIYELIGDNASIVQLQEKAIKLYKKMLYKRISTVTEVMDLNSKSNSTVDYQNLHAIYGQWEFSEPSSEYSNGTITMDRNTFDLTQVKPTEIPPKEKKKEEYLTED